MARRRVRQHEPGAIQQATQDYARTVGVYDADLNKAGFEAWYNHFSPFNLSKELYLIVLVLVLVAWVGSLKPGWP